MKILSLGSIFFHSPALSYFISQFSNWSGKVEINNWHINDDLIQFVLWVFALISSTFGSASSSGFQNTSFNLCRNPLFCCLVTSDGSLRCWVRGPPPPSLSGQNEAHALPRATTSRTPPFTLLHTIDTAVRKVLQLSILQQQLLFLTSQMSVENKKDNHQI